RLDRPGGTQGPRAGHSTAHPPRRPLFGSIAVALAFVVTIWFRTTGMKPRIGSLVAVRPPHMTPRRPELPARMRAPRTRGMWVLSLALFAQGSVAAAQTATPAKAPSSVQLQEAAVAAPTPSHATLAPSDASPPGQVAGGPAVPPPIDLPETVRLED